MSATPTRPLRPATRPLAAALLVLVALLVGTLSPAPSASASPTAAAASPAVKQSSKHRPKRLPRPAKVKVGRVALGATPEGDPALLVAIRYPIQALGRELSAEVRVAVPGRDLHSVITDRLSAGALRKGDRRRSFSFVHEFSLHPRVAAAVLLAQSEGRPVKVRVTADGTIDVDGDGRADLSSRDTGARVLPLTPLVPAYGKGARRAAAARAEEPFCASIPRLDLHPGQKVEYPLPACDRPVDWKVREQPSAGSARVAGSSLLITAGKRLAPMEIPLQIGPPVQVVVAAPKQLSVRAMGDSVTAGFGYYGDGSLMSILDLYECKPAGQYLNDACSSNSTSTHGTEKPEPVPYSPDYGLANNVSWAAQWSNAHGVTNYENLAVSGSEPVNWAPGGSLYATTRQIEAEDPTYILMTLGANPILSETLFGADPMGCALYSDVFGNYQECVEAAFAKVDLRRELGRVYTDLLAKTGSTIYLMQYHLSVPSSALLYTSTQIAEIDALMNRTIAEVAAEVVSPRLRVVTPPHFNVGVDLEPVYPADYECGDLFADHVDGPSVQSTATRAELRVLHPDEFCSGESSEGPLGDQRRHRHPPQRRRLFPHGLAGPGAGIGRDAPDPYSAAAPISSATAPRRYSKIRSTSRSTISTRASSPSGPSGSA